MDNQTGKQHEEELGYLFNVEILVKNKSNALALQSLLELLNSGSSIIDYRINSGIELGEIIESLLASRKQNFITKTYKRLGKAGAAKESGNPPAGSENKKSGPAPKTQPSGETAAAGNFKELAASEEFQAFIQSYITGNKLVRLLVNRNGKRINIPCRILNFLPETYALNVYHVDEKQVYTLKLSEIIDFLDT